MRARARKTFRVGALIAMLASAALVAGCASATGTTTTASTPSTLTYAINGGVLSSGKMDIHSSAFQITATVMRNTVDSLVYQTPDGDIVPWLASSWEISPDGLHYTFTLRNDVTFQDGEPFTAAAVKANFDHVVAPETASADAASLIGYAAEGGYYANTEVVDEFTVRVNFVKPYAPFLQAVSTAKLGFYSPKVLETKADQLAAGGPGISVGTGPYTMTEYVPNQKIVFQANPDYNWAPEGSKHEGAATIKTLVLRILTESSVRTGALTSGEVQVAGSIAANTVSQIGDGFTIEKIQDPGLPYSLFLNQKHGVFSDVNVRKAFAEAIDIDRNVTSVYQDQVDRAWSILTPATPNAYDPSVENSLAYDPKDANALLDAAGWTARDSDGYRTKDGTRLSVNWIAWTPVSDANASFAVAVQADLKKVGFEVIRDDYEVAKFYELYLARDFDLSDWSFPSVDADVLRAHLHTDGYKNGSSLSDPAVDKLLDDAVATADPAEREKLYQKLQRWNVKNLALIPIYVPTSTTAYSNAVTGLIFDLYGQPLFYGASLTAAG
ncbi:MAG: ABC transporter substrate-binding protein [Terrimesophilobacter sp.]